MRMAVEIAPFAPLAGRYTYCWPPHLGEPKVGIRVRVPLGNSLRTGLVTGLDAESESGLALKEVSDRLDAAPLYGAPRMNWLRRAASYYLAPLGEMAETAFAFADHDEERRYRLLDRPALESFSPQLAAAFTSRAALSLATLRARSDLPDCGWQLQQACRQGLIALREESAGKEAAHDHFHEERPAQLTAAQQTALSAVVASLGRFAPLLLFGCTGSGKSEVYLQAAEQVVAAGGQVLLLVPEIGLTPMWLARLASRFARLGVWHSGLSAPERRVVASRLAECDVLIGTRSALFLPLPRLALIVIDEEHDSSFKQQEGVSYSARDLALLLAQELKLPVLLGSATPSVESWSRAKAGHYQLLTMPERIAPHPAPRQLIVDQRHAKTPLSPQLLKSLADAFAKGEQALLYLNRRGYAPALHCTACGDKPQCPGCSLSLTLHRRRRALQCHACGYLRAVPRYCEACGEEALLPLGSGTEQVEELLRESLPAARFARFDRDTMTTPAKLAGLLAAFAKGEIDCLVGTQMLVKGHHFPKVTLVGVVNADLGLGLPDFRAGERWWQQLTQVVGRAGRGDQPGRVVIQSCDPENLWLARIGDRFAEATLNEELGMRRLLHYPPYARWVRLLFSAIDGARAEAAAAEFAALARRIEGIKVAGPMASAMERIAGRYRFELILRDESRQILPWRLAPLLQTPPPNGVRRKVDVDPLEMM